MKKIAVFLSSQTVIYRTSDRSVLPRRDSDMKFVEICYFKHWNKEIETQANDGRIDKTLMHRTKHTKHDAGLIGLFRDLTPILLHSPLFFLHSPLLYISPHSYTGSASLFLPFVPRNLVINHVVSVRDLDVDVEVTMVGIGSQGQGGYTTIVGFGQCG